MDLRGTAGRNATSRRTKFQFRVGGGIDLAEQTRLQGADSTIPVSNSPFNHPLRGHARRAGRTEANTCFYASIASPPNDAEAMGRLARQRPGHSTKQPLFRAELGWNVTACKAVGGN